MSTRTQPKYRNITVSGKIAAGTTTLAKSLKASLGWKYINTGAIQRDYDKKHNINADQHGALVRSDEHERETEAMTKKMLETESNLIYEAWLAGFVAQDIPGILKVLLICSEDAVRIDRIINRDRLTFEEAKHFIKQREEENEKKWKKLYGNYNFWDPKYYDLVIDTYSSGPMETLGRVLDSLNKS